MRKILLVSFCFFVLALSAKPRVKFKENFGAGAWGMYNPSAGIYFGPGAEFVYSPVLLNVNNTAFLMGDFVFRLSGTKNADAFGAGFGTDLEFRFYNKRITRARYGFSASYGWNSAIGVWADEPIVPVWGFDWVRLGMIFCDKGFAGKRQKLYYFEFQEWEGQVFVGCGVELFLVEVRPQLHSRFLYLSNSIKLKR